MPTIKDVAEKAGVTVTTVSRVLNNKGYISEATRRSVHRAMEELGYYPNEIARSLLRKKSNILGLIVPSVSHPFFAELINYIEYYAHEKGYKVLLCNSHLDKAKEKEYIDMLKSHKVDGIFMASHTLEVDEYLNLGFPLVTFDRFIAENIPFISSDNFEGGKLATNLLIDKGCKKIAHICGNLTLNLLANKRYEAFVETAKKRNVEYITVQTDINVFDISQYERMIFQLLNDHPNIDGVFASSDIQAAYVLKCCQYLNKRVPEDIKVVGYDDIKILSMISHQITTIRQPIEDIGKLAVELLIKQMNGEEITYKNVLPVSLIERSTT